jgi:RNA recognition motif-containing protein
MAASQKKNSLYVGGIAQQVTEEVLHAAFIPFGDIKSIQIPKDFTESKFLLLSLITFHLAQSITSNCALTTISRLLCRQKSRIWVC